MIFKLNSELVNIGKESSDAIRKKKEKSWMETDDILINKLTHQVTSESSYVSKDRLLRIILVFSYPLQKKLV